MQTIVDVNYDNSEMLLQVANGKDVADQQIPYDRISRIQFGAETVKSLFSTKTLPVIEIFLRGKDEPLVFNSKKCKITYDEAESMVLQFAEKHDIPVEKSDVVVEH